MAQQSILLNSSLNNLNLNNLTSNSNSNDNGIPLPLITVENDTHFIVHNDTLLILKKQNNPIGIVGVAGLYRTGKSYLLNLLTGNSSSGFAVGSTINACTKGIWIWSKPTYDPEKNIYVYYMDTEGLGSTSRSSTHDSRIFALALLLSSYFIYNSRGVIDGQALEDLSLVASLTQVIQSKSNRSSGNNLNDDDLSNSSNNPANQTFPIFVWVLRDFTLKLEDDQGKKISSNQYLEHCLKPQAGFSDAITSKNQIRRLISDSFRERECVTFVRPAEDENILRNLSQYRLEDLRPEFTKQIKNFLNKVSQGVRPKQVMGRTLNGEMFATLVVSYTEAINSGEVPEINSAWTRVISTQCNEAKQNALELYDSSIVEELMKNRNNSPRNKNLVNLQNALPVDYETLYQAHERIKSKSKYEYKTKLIDPYEDTPRHVASILKSELRMKLDSLIDENKKMSQFKSNNRVQDILDTILSGSGNLKNTNQNQGVLNIINDKLEKYRLLLSEFESITSNSGNDNDILGPLIWDTENQYLGNKMLEEISTWASTTSEYIRNTETLSRNTIHELELNMSTIRSTILTKETLLKQEEVLNERNENNLRERIDDEKKHYFAEIERKNIEKNRYTEMLNDLMTIHTTTMKSMTERKDSLYKQLETEREIVINEQKKLGNDRMAIKMEAKSSEEQHDTERKELEANLQKQTEHINQLKAELEQIEVSHLKTLNKKSEEYFNEVFQLKNQIAEDSKRLQDSFDREYKADKDKKQAEIKELKSKIKANQNILRQSGVDVGEPLANESDDFEDGNGGEREMKQQSSQRDIKKKNNKGGKGGCKQS